MSAANARAPALGVLWKGAFCGPHLRLSTGQRFSGGGPLWTGEFCGPICALEPAGVGRQPCHSFL